MEKIMQSRMDRGFQMYQKEYEDKALEVLRSGWYILGKEDEAFEKEFAAYIGTKYAVGVASGLDALWLAFRVLGIGKGDEVIVQGNTYIASVMGITINDATPVFVEPNSYYEIDENRIEEKITEKTKAVLVVHLYGQPAKMDRIREICDKHHTNIKIVIAPILDRRKLNTNDVAIVRKIFGSDNVFDFSNSTDTSIFDKHNFYDGVHYRTVLGRRIINSVYSKKYAIK